MTDQSDALIPYPHGREIVLRHKDSIVVFNPESQQLVSRNRESNRDVDLRDCPYCHRPLHEQDSDTSSRTRTSSTSVTATANFASPEYFRMLHNSLPASTEGSPRPSSPHKRIQVGYDGFAGQNTSAPPGAEFVASSPALDSSPKHGISTKAFSQNYFKNFFIEERELGRGNKGVVLLVKHVLDGVSLGHFALKRIPVGDNHKWLQKVLIEVQLLQHLSHQNLVSYRHVWLEEMQITTFGPVVPCAFILQQFCNAGDLQGYILGGLQNDLSSSNEELKQRMRRRSKGALEPLAQGIGPKKLQFEEIYAFFKDIASGLNHLHMNNYVHRDLKPQNCLLHHNGKEIRVLVSDFGEVQGEDQIRQSTGATGTISYCSPEVLRMDSATGRFGNFTAKSDIFSLGMILYFLCFAKLPYRNADLINEEKEDVDLLRQEIIGWIGLGDLKIARPDLPEKLYIFLRRLLSLDPANRPTAEEILQSIKTGSGLSEAEERKQSQDDARISRIDTPPPLLTGRRSSTAVSRIVKQPPSRLQFSLSKDDNDDSGNEDEIQAPQSANSLVLHSRHTSPTRVQTIPSSPREPWWRWLIFAQQVHPRTLLTMKVAFLLLKILSIYLLCLPSAAEPRIGLTLLGMATVDLLVLDISLTMSLLLLTVHICTLWFLQNQGMACLSSRPPTTQNWDYSV